jgi:hypothetical protein
MHDEDHRTVVEYIRSILIIHGLVLAIVTGRAGTTAGHCLKNFRAYPRTIVRCYCQTIIRGMITTQKMQSITAL